MQSMDSMRAGSLANRRKTASPSFWSPEGIALLSSDLLIARGWEEADVSLGIYDLVGGKTNYLLSNGQLPSRSCLVSR